jgi:hypothetical protein
VNQSLNIPLLNFVEMLDVARYFGVIMTASPGRILNRRIHDGLAQASHWGVVLARDRPT